MSESVAADKVVVLDYVLKDEAGEILDSSSGAEPLVYIHGAGALVPGLEQALEGKSAGERVQVKVPPESGYGSRDEELVIQVPSEQLEGDEELEVGMDIHLESDEGEHLAVVTEVAEEFVTLDVNHPLAGVTLDFDVTVVDVRDATSEELQSGFGDEVSQGEG